MKTTSLAGRAVVAAALMLWPARAANASGPGDPQSKITPYVNADAPSAPSPSGAATITPDTLFFTHQVGRLYLLAPFQFAHLQSSDAPAAYVAEVKGPDSLFAWVAEPKGITPDTVMVQIGPPDVPGTFVNTVLFHVQGVAEPTRLVVHLVVTGPDSSAATAWVVPNAIYFQAQAGTEALLYDNVIVLSSPLGLAFSGRVLPGGAQLTHLADPAGVTPESVTVVVEPARAFSAGLYEDTVVFQVDGVPYPVPLFVMINITDTTLPPPHDTAWAQPSTLYFTTVEGFALTVMLSQWVHVFSSNAPADYVAGVYGPDPVFTYLADSTGRTNDSMEILVNPAGWKAGTYHNAVRFYVNGLSVPAQVNVQLLVYPDSSGGEADSAVVVPPSLSVQAPLGSGKILRLPVMLYSSNAPALYFAYVASWPSFVSVPDSVGHTNDSVQIAFDPAGKTAGIYRDTVIFEVQGTARPVRLPVELLVTPGDSVLSLLALRNYPNPFNPETRIAFTLTAPARVTLGVHNILGERVLTLVDRELPAGEQQFTWDGRAGDGRQAPSGVYFYRLSVQDRVYTGKMMMLR